MCYIVSLITYDTFYTTIVFNHKISKTKKKREYSICCQELMVYTINRPVVHLYFNLDNILFINAVLTSLCRFKKQKLCTFTVYYERY